MNTSALSTLFPSTQNYFNALSAEPEHQHGKENKANDLFAQKQNRDLYYPQSVSTELSLQNKVQSVQHSADIQIKTQEGDIVTINLHEAVKQSSSRFSAERGNESIDIYSASKSYQSSFSFSVEGDLSEQEQESLADLINKISKISEKFFKGNVQAAFNHAQKVGFDTEQIAGFSLDLNRQRSVQAIAAYQQTMQPEQTVNRDLLEQANAFLAESKNFLAEGLEQISVFPEPEKLFVDLSSSIGEMQRQIESAQNLYLDMIEHLKDDLF